MLRSEWIIKVEEIMGSKVCGNRNGNRGPFLDFCYANSLVIGGSISPHEEIHKVTWISPDGVTKNQIDHITINRCFRRASNVVGVYRSADIIENDHELVMAKIRLKLCRKMVKCHYLSSKEIFNLLT